jgi:signal transduction histidine kinase
MAASAAAVLLVAILLRRRDVLALRFAALVQCFGLWALGRGLARLDWSSGAPLEGLALAALGPIALGFTVEVGGPHPRLRRLRVPLAIATGALAFAALVTSFGPLPVRAAVTAFAAANGLAAAALSWWLRPTPAQTPDDARLRYLAAAHGVAGAGIVADLGLAVAGGPRVGTLLGGLAYLYVGYLYLGRIRVADLRQLLGNTVALILLAAGLAALFAALHVWVGPRLDVFAFDAFVASFALLLFYAPARDRIQSAIERRLVADKLELERTLQPLAERLPQIVTLDELLRELLATLERTDRVTSSAIYLREDPNVGFRLVASIGLPPRPRVNLIRDPAFEAELEAGEALLDEELEKALPETRSREERERLAGLAGKLRELDAQLVLPLCAGSELLGFWTLTHASEREPFSSTELRVLRAIADLAAKSVEQSRTFEAVRARDRLAALGEMAGGLAHEIRNPLATIRTALAVMEESGELGPDLRSVIIEEVARLNRVITLFLDYARPSVRRVRIEDPGEFVRACVRAVARHHPGEDVRVAVEVAAGLPAITADADRLHTIIENVVQNAYEALAGKGRIRVAVRPVPGAGAEGAVEIALEDDGPGMDEETLARAFLPFFTTKDGGTGLGLALCERLIRAQGGTIELSARPGEGTSVRIRLPVGGAEEPA